MTSLFLPPKSPNHANRGRPFEQLLGLQLERYRREGWLVIRQYPAVLLQDGGRTARVIGKAPPDWILYRNGLFLALDAKSYQGDRWPLSEVADHQAAWFDATERSGGVAGVVLVLAGVVWWVGWDELGPRWRRWREGKAGWGEASMGEVQLVEAGELVTGMDFLAVAGIDR
jgi:penicillin-binding protein-related factor A (putative recombinase)